MECEHAVDKRRRYKILSEQDALWEDKYKEARQEAKRIIRSAKRKHLENIVRGMESLMKANHSRKFYQEVNSYRKGYQPTSQILEDDQGNLVTDGEVIKTQWASVFLTTSQLSPSRRASTSNYRRRPVRGRSPYF